MLDRSSGISESNALNVLGSVGDGSVYFSKKLKILEGRVPSLGFVCDNPVMEELGFDISMDQGSMHDGK